MIRLIFSILLFISFNSYAQSGNSNASNTEVLSDDYKKFLICTSSYENRFFHDPPGYIYTLRNITRLVGKNNFEVTNNDCQKFENFEYLEKVLVSRFPKFEGQISIVGKDDPYFVRKFWGAIGKNAVYCSIYIFTFNCSSFKQMEIDKSQVNDAFSREVNELRERQQKIDEERAEQQRIRDYKNRKYSTTPATIKVQIQGSQVIITSVDNDPFLLERVVFNNRVGVTGCDNGPYVEYMSMGDSRRVTAHNCGDTIVKIDVFTNRGNSSYRTK